MKQAKQSKPQEPKLGSIIPQKPHQIVFLNGPPGCGKDTAAAFAYNEYPGIRVRKFAGPLKHTAKAMFSLTDAEFQELERPGNTKKDEKSPRFMSMSYREVLIWLSEDVMKPKFGDNIFGKLLVNELTQASGSKMTIISDSGFAEEAIPVVTAFGAKNCHVFRIYREGCNFDNDSRSYWNNTQWINHYEIRNEHSLLMFRVQVLRRIDKILGTEGKEYSI